MSKESLRFDRRTFLRMAGLTAAGWFFSSCAPKEPTPEPSPTPFPTEAPKPTPTETLKQKWGKVWVIGEGMGTGEQEGGLTKDKERFGDFIEQITRQLEVKGESLKQTELFVGAFPKPEIDAKGKPRLQTVGQEEKDWIFCAYVFSKTGERKVYCALEEEKGKEAQVGTVSTVFTPEEKIWGVSCQEKVDGSVIVSCEDGTIYKTGKSILGADLTQLTSASGEETMTGYLFTAVAFEQKELLPSTFFLSIKDEKKLPVLPEGKSGFNMEKFIPVFSLASARFDVWESSPEKDNPYIGNWDLEKGEWVGEKGWEGEAGYGKLFIEVGLPEVILSPEEEQLHADIISIYGGEQSVDADIFKALEDAKKYDPKKFPENMEQYTYYTTISSALIGEYYASSGDLEKRNPEILKIFAQIRELARQNPFFEEKHWIVEGAENY